MPRSHTILSTLSTDVLPVLLWHARKWRSLLFHLEDILNVTLTPIYEESPQHSSVPLLHSQNLLLWRWRKTNSTRWSFQQKEQKWKETIHKTELIIPTPFSELGRLIQPLKQENGKRSGLKPWLEIKESSLYLT